MRSTFDTQQLCGAEVLIGDAINTQQIMTGLILDTQQQSCKQNRWSDPLDNEGVIGDAIDTQRNIGDAIDTQQMEA